MKDARPRMISLRLSEEELDLFGELVALHRFESISDLVRNAVARLRSAPAPTSIDEIRGKLVMIDRKLETLTHLVENNAVKLAGPPNFRSATCVNSDCGKCERCDWERGRGLVV